MGGFIDLTGKRFGRLVVIYRVQNQGKKTRWLCKCDCGKEKKVLSFNLTSGKTKSCGCFHRVPKNLTGMKFNRWVVIRRASNKGKQPYWLCRCECGIEKEVKGDSLRHGLSKSCGCYFKEMMSKEHRIEYELSSKREVYKNYKRHSKERNLIFDLSFDQFLELTKQNCHYCGTEPNNLMKSESNNGNFIYQGIDRKDNNKGYTIDNVVSCCKICNRAKSNMSYEEFMNWIKKVASHNY